MGLIIRGGHDPPNPPGNDAPAFWLPQECFFTSYFSFPSLFMYFFLNWFYCWRLRPALGLHQSIFHIFWCCTPVVITWGPQPRLCWPSISAENQRWSFFLSGHPLFGTISLRISEWWARLSFKSIVNIFISRLFLSPLWIMSVFYHFLPAIIFNFYYFLHLLLICQFFNFKLIRLLAFISMPCQDFYIFICFTFISS